jgi:L-lactate dehydrogenase complex protein LldG
MPPPLLFGGDNSAERFAAEARAVNAQVTLFEDRAAGIKELENQVRGKEIFRWDVNCLPLGCAEAADRAAAVVRDSGDAQRRSAEIGLTSCNLAIAETGSVALVASPGRCREASLAVQRHLVLLSPWQIVADMSTALSMLRQAGGNRGHWNIITGPSRTADIEMTLTQGVHGPKELHLLIAPWQGQEQRGNHGG